MKRTLLIRTDASTKIGTGHVMRCLALAQAWQEVGGEVVFVMAYCSPAIEKRVVGEGFVVERMGGIDVGDNEDAAAVVRLAKTKGVSWVAVDGYHFRYKYQRALKSAGLRILLVDDKGCADKYCVDFVLNQNIHADESMYASHEGQTRLLLGTQYALLRKEFWPWRGWKREVPSIARKVLVTLGGSDPDNATLKVIQALSYVAAEGLEVTVVVGANNLHYNELYFAVQNSEVNIRLEHNVTNMPELMAWADMAVSSGGTTVWELAFMGLPALIGIIATVEELLVTGLVQHGLFSLIGWFEWTSVLQIVKLLGSWLTERSLRERMARLGPQIVDGNGGSRVVKALVQGMQ